MVAIDHVVEIIAVRIPKARLKGSATHFKDGLPTRGELRADRERIQPERLDFHRFADARRNFAPVNARVHPGELVARFAGGEQTIGIGMNTETRAIVIAGRGLPRPRRAIFRSGNRG